MSWKKLGNIFCPEAHFPWMKSHATVPFIGKTTDAEIQIFFSTRDEDNRSNIGGLLFSLQDFKITKLFETPFLTPGPNGNFDHDGVMGCHITEVNGSSYLYYIGWNLGVSVPFRNAIGVAEYKNEKFEKLFSGPIVDRSIYDPCFVASNCIIKINDRYVMYYLSCIKWVQRDGKLTHYYHIKIATSVDGIEWHRSGKVAIDFKDQNEFSISVPRALYENGIYKMWYSYRSGFTSKTYRIGYAESQDGFDWKRKDNEAGIDVSETGWDSQMICYPFVFDHGSDRYMLYNGNDYGKTGIGLAVLV